MNIPILYEDGEALVIDKPAGLPIERPRKGGASLEDHLDSLKLGFQTAPMPVHRLDTDTSGCLLLARNHKALRRFNAAFEARLVQKVYLGIVAGTVAEEEGTIELGLSKISSAEKGWRMIVAKKGKPAITHWRKLRRTSRRDHAGGIPPRNRAHPPDSRPCRTHVRAQPARRSGLRPQGCARHPHHAPRPRAHGAARGEERRSSPKRRCPPIS